MARVHYGWVVAGAAFATLVAAAAFRAAPGPLMVPLHEDLDWSIVTMSAAVSVNLVLYGLTAPFAAALMERFGPPRSRTPSWSSASSVFPLHADELPNPSAASRTRL